LNTIFDVDSTNSEEMNVISRLDAKFLHHTIKYFVLHVQMSSVSLFFSKLFKKKNSYLCSHDPVNRTENVSHVLEQMGLSNLRYSALFIV